jgi:hypothetical protein
MTRLAFGTIVDHARKSKVSEQPSFNAIVCNHSPSERHFSSCTYCPRQEDLPNNLDATESSALLLGSLSVETLDGLQFPNGAVLVGGNNKNAYKLGRDAFAEATGVKLLATHNNDEHLGCQYVGEELSTEKS